MLEGAFLKAARRLVAARSVTDEGNLPAVRALEPECRAAGLEPVVLPAPGGEGRDANLLAGPGGGPDAAGAPLLLVTHLDTVGPGPRDRWQSDPFTLTVKDGLAYGLGTADVKLDALCKLWAARRLRGVRLRRPFWFLGTYGEEAGLRGAREFVRAAPLAPAYVLCGEPCENRLHHAHKGYAMVRVALEAPGPVGPAGREEAFEGRAAHSSTPQLGVNAVERALEALAGGVDGVVAIEGGTSPNTVPARCCVTYGGEARGGLWPLVARARGLVAAWRGLLERLEPREDPRFAPATAVGSVTMARTRGATLELVLDARLLPAHDPERLIEAFCAAAGGDVRVEVLRRSQGMDEPADGELARRAGSVLARLGLDPAPLAKPTSTEGGVFARAGAQALVFGPSRSTGNAHAPDEHAHLGQVERAIDVYEALIRELCEAG
jgi:acetylornithine deacetylase/succinyl-diaminopimelate desuccinylase-like protein